LNHNQKVSEEIINGTIKALENKINTTMRENDLSKLQNDMSDAY